MNKLKELLGEERFRTLPATLQLTKGRPVTDTYSFSMKSAPSGFHQTEERVLSYSVKVVSKIVKPDLDAPSKDVF